MSAAISVQAVASALVAVSTVSQVRNGSSALARLLKRNSIHPDAITITRSRIRIPLVKPGIPTVKKSVAKISAQENQAVSRVVVVAQPSIHSLRGEILKLRSSIDPRFVMFVQVGGFYEIYDYVVNDFEAICVHLGLAVSVRDKDRGDVYRVAGFPMSSYERFVNLLLESGRPVAIVEQGEKDLISPSKSYLRSITRFITPGTPLLQSSVDVDSIEENIRDTDRANCFLLAISTSPSSTFDTGANDKLSSSLPIGLSWTDISTGEFFVYESTLGSLASDITRISPMEIVASSNLPAAVLTAIKSKTDIENIFLTLRTDPFHFDPQTCILQALQVQERLDPLTSLNFSLKSTDFVTEVNTVIKAEQLLMSPASQLVEEKDNTCESEQIEIPMEGKQFFDETASLLAKSPPKLKLLGNIATPSSVVAAGALFKYLDEIFCGIEPHFHSNAIASISAAPVTGKSSGVMKIDAATMMSLEIIKTIRDREKKGTLFNEINQTKTAQGERLLAARLKSPSTLLPEINRRLTTITPFCVHSATLTPRIQTILSSIRDLERALQRLHMNAAKPRDFMNVLTSLESMNNVKKVLEANEQEWHTTRETSDDGNCKHDVSGLVEVLGRVTPPMNLVEKYGGIFGMEGVSEADDGQENREQTKPKRIGNAPGNSSESGSGYEFMTTGSASRVKAKSWQAGTIGSGVDEVLDELRLKHRALVDEKNDLCSSLSAKYGGIKIDLVDDIKDGACITVPTSKMSPQLLAKLTKDPFVGTLQRQKHITKQKFTYQVWTDLYNRAKLVEDELIRQEIRIFEDACKEVLEYTREIIRSSEAIAEIDVAASMGLIASKWNYVKPEMVNECILDIKEARHPVVENMQILRSQQQFTANDLLLDPETRMWIMTGPNMGGKSTFLRQSALIIIMAQAGLYVPATAAKIGIVDSVFSRVGASDNLAANQSTFK
ncbi:DNA mismatch repair ATPase msh1, partial [Physocladia obscura]